MAIVEDLSESGFFFVFFDDVEFDFVARFDEVVCCCWVELEEFFDVFFDEFKEFDVADHSVFDCFSKSVLDVFSWEGFEEI